MLASAYQNETRKFAVYPKENALEYLTLGLASEAGEVAGKVKKYLRGDYVVADPMGEGLVNCYQDEQRLTSELASEIGDTLWYISELCNFLDLDMEEVMQWNIGKLEDRKARSVLKGNGDDR